MTNCKKIERLIVKYINSSRRKHGKSSLKVNWGLTRIARSHSKRMAKSKRIWHGNGVHMAGSSITYKGFWGWIKSLFYSGYGGENVGLMPTGRVKGFKHTIRSSKDIAQAQHRALMNSAGHRANILNSKFELIGIGVKKRGNRYYTTELFYG